jgi:hypothetical protein
MPRTVIQTQEAPVEKRKRAYNGPPKGSEEAKARMEAVRAAQWAKHGLKLSNAK